MAITFNHNDKLYVSGSNVGIGTDSPTSILHLENAGNTWAKFINTSGTNQRLDVGTNSSSQHFVFGYGAYPVLFGSNGAERMRIDSSGNVGIGTTNPDLKLHLAHSDNNNGLLLEHTSQASGFQVLQNIRETEGLIWQRWSSGTFSSNLMTLTYSGELGIGTTSPDQKLQIHDSSSTGVYLHVTNSTTGEDGGNGALFGISSNEEALVWNYENTATRFSTNGSERMRIASDGNVGIGTTSPGNALEINPPQVSFNLSSLPDGNIALSNNSSAANSPTIAGKSENGGQAGLQFITGTPDTNSNADMIFSVRESDNTDFSTTTSIAYNFLRYTTSLLAIKRDGKVGIGTTSPSYKLDVGGGNFFVNGSNRDWGGTGGLGTHIGTGDFDIYKGTPGSGTHRFKVTNAGNVGIGTTSPGSPLHVAGDIGIAPTGDGVHIGKYSSSGNVYGHIQLQGNKGGYIDFSTSGTDFRGRILYDAGSNYMRLDTNGSEKMRITSGGNVGIGTTSPSAKLHINGSSGNTTNNADIQLCAENSGIFVDDANSDNSRFGIVKKWGSTTMVAAGSATPIKFGHWSTTNLKGNIQSGSFTERLTIATDGKVGVGAASPAEKLHIAGNIKATGWIGRDSDNYITFDETNNHIDFYAGGNWVARMESDGDLHVKGDVIAFSDIFNP